MKALLVNEVQGFKRGIGSRESLDIGIEAQKKNWWKNERHDSRDLIISVLNRALKDSNSYMDVYPSSSFGVGYPLEIKYRLETPNPPLKSKYITLIINNKGNIFLPGFDGKYLGNFTELVDKKFEKNLRTNLNRIVIDEEILESINFERGIGSRKSLEVGSHREIKIGDKFKILKKLWWHPGTQGKEIGQWHDKPMGRISDDTQMNINDIIIVKDFVDYDNNYYHNKGWIETISSDEYKKRGLKIDWIKKNMNKYLERI